MVVVKEKEITVDYILCIQADGQDRRPSTHLTHPSTRRCKTAQAKIVLSTDWRRVPALKAQLINTLRSMGMEVIGATPCRPTAGWRVMWRALNPSRSMGVVGAATG